MKRKGYKRNSRRANQTGRRVGLFLGGMAFGLIRGIFFRNKY